MYDITDALGEFSEKVARIARRRLPVAFRDALRRTFLWDGGERIIWGIWARASTEGDQTQGRYTKRRTQALNIDASIGTQRQPGDRWRRRRAPRALSSADDRPMGEPHTLVDLFGNLRVFSCAGDVFASASRALV